MGKYIIKEQKIKDRDIERVRKITHFLADRFNLEYTIYKCLPIIKVSKGTERQLAGLNSDYYDSYKNVKRENEQLKKEISMLKSKLK